MRRVIYVGMSCALGIVLWSSCSKGKSASSGSMSASVGSTQFSTQSTTGTYVPSQRMIEFVGVSIKPGDTTQLMVFIPDSVALNVAIPFSSGAGLTWSDSTGFYDGDEIFGHGSVTLTALDTIRQTVTGTFSGTLSGGISGNQDSVVITGGQFSGSYYPN